ncbi:hypothetical protein P7K49_021219, partial [Saguinus oedipus]
MKSETISGRAIAVKAISEKLRQEKAEKGNPRPGNPMPEKTRQCKAIAEKSIPGKEKKAWQIQERQGKAVPE